MNDGSWVTDLDAPKGERVLVCVVRRVGQREFKTVTFGTRAFDGGWSVEVDGVSVFLGGAMRRIVAWMRIPALPDGL